MDENDYFKSELGVQIWNLKYRNDNESFDDWLTRVSGGDAEVHSLIKSKKFMFGGRILANRGIECKNVSMSNCYYLGIKDDSLESIHETAGKLARIFSAGGGVGIDLSTLAPRGAKINNAAKTTSGAVSFAELFSTTAGLVGMDGRRAALLLSLKSEHPDLREFITAKSDNESIKTANLSVRASNVFMNAVTQNLPHYMSFKRHTGEEIEVWDDANDIMDLLVKNNYDYAEPGILYDDRMCNYNMMQYIDEFQISGVNPCTTYDTKILTDEGYVCIGDVSGEQVNVWNGYEFSTVTPVQTGEFEPIYKVSFSDGSELKCTGYHVFNTWVGFSKQGHGVQKKCIELNIGDKLEKYGFPIIDTGIDYNEKLMYTQGFYSSDGHVDRSSRYKRNAFMWMYHMKQDLIGYCVYNSMYVDAKQKRTMLRLPETINIDKTFVPDTTYSIKSRLDWLAGLIDNDGCKNSSEGSIAISSVNRDFLMDVKFMLNTIGINTHVNSMEPEGYNMLPDGKGGLKKYFCNECFRMVISAYHVEKLLTEGLNLHRVDVKPETNRDAGRFVSVTAIEDLDTIESKVYCFNEPKNHTGVFNGIVTGQCGEAPLPDNGACLLGSLNLSEFEINGMFDYRSFEVAVIIAISALNDVLDEGIDKHPLPEQSDVAKKWRQIGLGVMGYADALIKLGITYGSEECIEFTQKLSRTMFTGALKESSTIHPSNSIFDRGQLQKIVDSEIIQLNCGAMLKSWILEHGLRNATLLSIAPTGSISTMLGISGGIEPHYALSYTRRTESLHGEDKSYDVEIPIIDEFRKFRVIKEKEGFIFEGDSNGLPSFFVTAKDIHWKDRLRVQEAWQNSIDASISSTINLPEDTSEQTIKRIYIEAWRRGVKGITVYRDNCSRQGVLSETKEVIVDALDDAEQIEILRKENMAYLDTIEESKPFKRGDWNQLSDDITYIKRKIRTGCGKLTLFIGYSIGTKKIEEIYTKRSGKGGCARSLDALAITMSSMLRLGGTIENIRKAFEGLEPCSSFERERGKGKSLSQGSNCANAMLREMELFMREVDEMPELTTDIETEPVCDYDALVEDVKDGFVIDTNGRNTVRKLDSATNQCPECKGELMHSGGCVACQNCGYTKCN